MHPATGHKVEAVSNLHRVVLRVFQGQIESPHLKPVHHIIFLGKINDLIAEVVHFPGIRLQQHTASSFGFKDLRNLITIREIHKDPIGALPSDQDIVLQHYRIDAARYRDLNWRPCIFRDRVDVGSLAAVPTEGVDTLIVEDRCEIALSSGHRGQPVHFLG